MHTLVKDQEKLFTFLDYPAAHWIHLRTTNAIESTLLNNISKFGTQVLVRILPFGVILGFSRTGYRSQQWLASKIVPDLHERIDSADPLFLIGL